MTTYQKFIQKDVNKIDTIIYAFYEEYKKIINCYDLPTFQIKYLDGREDKNICFQVFNMIYDDPITLVFNIDVIDFYSFDFKVLLVHEFTHIYDYHILKQKYNIDFIRKSYSMYSEYHAVQIETLYQFNLIKYLSDNIIVKDQRNIINGILNEIEIYHTNSKLYNNHKNKTTFVIAVKSYLYASGIISIANQILNLNIEMEDFFEPYKELMHEAIKLLWSVKYDDIPSKDILTKIGEINQQITYIE